jgi:NAD(P)H-hydrate epimerase
MTDVVVAILPSSTTWRESYHEKVDILNKLNIPVFVETLPDLDCADIIIDGIFGIGLSRPPTGIYQAAINAINAARAIVVSLDIPSGIDGRTGEKLSQAIFSDYCVSYGLLKIGNLLNYGYAHTEELLLSLLNSPYLAASSGGDVSLNTPMGLQRRDKLGYKNAFGRALVVGGSEMYHGAPYFTVAAFMKSGGGYVHLVTPQSVAASVAVKFPECVLHPQDPTENGTLPHSAFSSVENLSTSQDILIFGPGIGISKTTELLLKDILLSHSCSTIPLLIDGDGLSLLANNIDLLGNREPYSVILTPHLGEMSRLTGLSVTEIQNHKIEVAKKYSSKWKVILVLKGPRTVVAADEKIYINTTGTETLGTAGAGDVLDGIIGALAATEPDLVSAVRTAVFAHGLIGNLLSAGLCDRCVTASDILNTIPSAFTELNNYVPGNTNRTPVDLPGVRFLV